MSTQRTTRISTRHPLPSKPKAHRSFKLISLVVILLIFLTAGVYALNGHKNPAKTVATKISHQVTTHVVTTKPATTTTTTPAAPKTACSSNTLAQNVNVSIAQQHLWACAGSNVAYDSAVVTGMELYPADLTPTGTYHVYAKITNTTLNGHDSTGSWSDPVSYWMPFLDNQYGEYGFHDATWRAPTDFGHINIYNPYTDIEHGSHGCVELPLATAKWLYGWDVVGTTVTIES
jgi:lipoprotein-anchoring transpeptidase ErfK/SrfK